MLKYVNFESKMAASHPFLVHLQIWLDVIKDELKLHVCTKNEYITYHSKWDIKEKVKCLPQNCKKLAILDFF